MSGEPGGVEFDAFFGRPAVLADPPGVPKYRWPGDDDGPLRLAPALGPSKLNPLRRHVDRHSRTCALPPAGTAASGRPRGADVLRRRQPTRITWARGPAGRKRSVGNKGIRRRRSARSSAVLCLTASRHTAPGGLRRRGPQPSTLQLGRTPPDSLQVRLLEGRGPALVVDRAGGTEGHGRRRGRTDGEEPGGPTSPAGGELVPPRRPQEPVEFVDQVVVPSRRPRGQGVQREAGRGRGVRLGGLGRRWTEARDVGAGSREIATPRRLPEVGLQAGWYVAQVHQTTPSDSSEPVIRRYARGPRQGPDVTETPRGDTQISRT